MENPIAFGKQARLAHSGIEIKPSPIHRYGVFATKYVAPGETVEECPIVFIKEDSAKYFKNLIFYWKKDEAAALALGYGSLYNHADKPNAEAIPDHKNKLLLIKAIKPIYEGEEIFVYYGKDWFVSRNITPLPLDRPHLIRKTMRLIGLSLILAIPFFLGVKNNTFSGPITQAENAVFSIM
jgi:uncharacterized protein